MDFTTEEIRKRVSLVTKWTKMQIVHAAAKIWQVKKVLTEIRSQAYMQRQHCSVKGNYDDYTPLL